MKHFKAKVDNNQKKIVEALRAIGAVVKHVHQVKNLFDILVAYRGEVFLIEIKNGDEFPKKFWKMDKEERDVWMLSKLEEGEMKCKNDFESVGVKYHIAYNIDSALKIINNGI